MSTVARIKYKSPGSSSWGYANVVDAYKKLSNSEIIAKAQHSFPGAEIEIETVDYM